MLIENCIQKTLIQKVKLTNFKKNDLLLLVGLLVSLTIPNAL